MSLFPSASKKVTKFTNQHETTTNKTEELLAILADALDQDVEPLIQKVVMYSVNKVKYSSAFLQNILTSQLESYSLASSQG